jgi:hypothetical protein
MVRAEEIGQKALGGSPRRNRCQDSSRGNRCQEPVSHRWPQGVSQGMNCLCSIPPHLSPPHRRVELCSTLVRRREVPGLVPGKRFAPRAGERAGTRSRSAIGESALACVPLCESGPLPGQQADRLALTLSRKWNAFRNRENPFPADRLCPFYLPKLDSLPARRGPRAEGGTC